MDSTELLLKNLVLFGVPRLIAELGDGDFREVKNNSRNDGFDHHQLVGLEELKSEKLSKHTKITGSVEVVIIEVNACMSRDTCVFKDICNEKSENLKLISGGECDVVRMFYVAPKINEELGWYQSLSCRERQILQLVSKGYAHKTIAREINISVYTVNDHLKSIYRKMGVRSKGEASFLARRTIFA